MPVRKRLVAAIIVDQGLVVNRYQFGNSRPVGRPEYTLEALERWQIDELCVLDISGASLSARRPNATEALVTSFSSQTPLTVGGGISSASDAKSVVRAGAERVILGGAAFAEPGLVREVSEEVGEQAVVVSVPFFSTGADLFWSMPRREARRPLEDLLSCIGDSFRGEILLQSMVRDGMNQFTDLSPFLDALNLVGSLRCVIMGGLTTSHQVEAALTLDQVSAVCVGNRMHAEELLGPRLKSSIDAPVRPYRRSDNL